MQSLLLCMGFLLAQAACAAPQVLPSAPTATGVPGANRPNPASVYCVQTGNQLEIRTANDGGQAGVCIFPDGGTCDEWAYFRGACGPAAPSDTQPLPTAVVVIEATRNWAADGSGGYLPPGTTEEIADWWGVIKSTPPGAQYEDYFERQDFGGAITFGIDSSVPEVQSQIEALRDSGKIVHLYGVLFSNVPDHNGSQIQVERIEIEG